MKLADYMKSCRMTDEAMAKKIGINRASVTRHRNGTLLPSLKTVAEYAAATGGIVSANDFLPLNVGMPPTPTTLPINSSELAENSAEISEISTEPMRHL